MLEDINRNNKAFNAKEINGEFQQYDRFDK